MQIFKAAILLVSSIGSKVALGCYAGFEKGCAFKPDYASDYSAVRTPCSHQLQFEVCCPAGVLQQHIRRKELVPLGCKVNS
ncbi:uncharacterized protein PGTG_13574 [Puccinia graminis f. sp. tritici CRL 75-36-700-3]|uniref:Secreted protein n=1 Tax=Puccinia graminis f. sp. tritici (strain CRL 75-36-700-3 / race SCCL) TaxID=418459 RepID=E3KSW0_PUCGT|nr:uncharacterized protein PGTG_13574 [Puccinia graminis f. sp. tritici CRL 75-36-700-3]EFP87346.2 hypothetical protein PGTG_13574 [Puccinia graminis f. sp. tritici CRL 75-36-700-3]